MIDLIRTMPRSEYAWGLVLPALVVLAAFAAALSGDL